MENKELETWLKKTKAKNLNLEELERLIVGEVYHELEGNTTRCKASILFNQWQQESEFSPKIIGYKAPFDLFNGVIKKGHLFIEWTKKHYYSAVNENVSNYSLPKEIVETWEPEFEPLPTETDFKSKVIELIRDRIVIANNNLYDAVQNKLYDDAAIFQKDSQKLVDLLNEIIKLC